MRKFTFVLAALSALSAVFAGNGLAQDVYKGTITFVVPSSAGSAPDTYARVVADRMQQELDQTIVVEDKPGANGNLAAQAVLAARPSGSAVLIATQSLMEINPSTFANIPWKLSDFTPLIKGVEAPLVLVTTSDVPAKNLKELVAWAKGKNDVSFASFFAGTPSHFLGDQMNERFGLNMVHVPYRGSGRQATALVGKQVQLGFAQVSVALPHVKSGALTAIATTGNTRFRLMPDVPTFAELGYPEFTTTVWFGLAVPSDTPKPMLDRLLAAAKVAHSDPAIREKLEKIGFDVPALSGPEFTADIRKQIQRWKVLVEKSGFKVN